jgi:Tfp pilus assembly protein PilO
VDTVKELRNRVLANLYAKLVEVNEKKKLTRRLPSESQIADMIEQAKTLPPKMTY